jgi:hypothetical protein
MADDTAWVRVVPEETDEILANPGMGWETFHRTANNDKNLPSWIPSTVHYARWGWRELEPEQGKIAYDFLDGVLKETREAGQAHSGSSKMTLLAGPLRSTCSRSAAMPRDSNTSTT